MIGKGLDDDDEEDKPKPIPLGYVKKEPWTKQLVVDDDGGFGKLRIDLNKLAQGVLVATPKNDPSNVILNHQAGSGLRHILTSKRMGKNMRDQIKPDDIRHYQKIVELARVRPTSGTQQRVISELAVVELSGMTKAQLVNRLNDLIASINAGNSGRSKLIRNEAIAIVDKLVKDGVISRDEGNQIIENNEL